MPAGTPHFVISAFSTFGSENLEGEPAASQPGLPVPLCKLITMATRQVGVQ